MTGATATLSITFTSWWLGGTGGSGKGDLDVVAYRDQWGCPALPMTQIKGTLRETADRFWDSKRVIDWFGGEGSDGQSQIRFSGDASLLAEQAKWFGYEDNHAKRATLFSAIRSTALACSLSARSRNRPPPRGHCRTSNPHVRRIRSAQRDAPGRRGDGRSLRSSSDVRDSVATRIASLEK